MKPTLFADFVFQDILRAWSATSSSRTEALIMFGAIILVSSAAFFIVVLLSQRRKRRKRHRRHHDQLPLNPTLAQTGGLPPARPHEDDSSSL